LAGVDMSLVPSPLFEPVHWRGAGFEILDEIQVPDRIEYIEVNEVEQALAAVAEMRTRAYGQVLTFLYSTALLAQRFSGKDPAPLRQQIEQLTEQFCAVRPTFDFRGLGAYVANFFNNLPDSGSVGDAIAGQARELGAQITRARNARAKRAATVLPNPARLLTHCNVSGELVAVASHCREMGKVFSVIATETRPYLQGARLTAWELAQAGVEVALIPDCAVAQVLAKGTVNAVMVGADRSARNGDIINKVGTYPIARLAKEYGVPFHALVQEPRGLNQGSDVAIEERPADELLSFAGRSLIEGAYTTLAARYPAFDVTPAWLISFLVGFDDLYSAETFRRKYQVADGEKIRAAVAKERYLLLYGLPSESQYRALTEALQAAQAYRLLVPEMRPQLWGAQSVARALLDLNAPVTVISDNMMGTLFAQGEIAKLCFFYNRLADQGATGIAGSLLAVQLARLHGVPIELWSGEERVGAPVDVDVSTFLGKKIRPAGVSILPLESDLVPWRLLRE
jgi:methylthioribose-1-phosphate isomerase